jgi:hypothetical protein
MSRLFPPRGLLGFALLALGSFAVPRAAEAQLLNPPTPVTLPLPVFAAAAAGDFTGDGLADIVASVGAPNAGFSPIIFVNDGGGGFDAAHGPVLNFDTAPPSSYTVLDVDGDGFLDAVTVAGAMPVILWGDGSPFFVSSTALGGLTIARQAEVADFDEDGINDIVVAGSTRGAPAVIAIFKGFGGHQRGFASPELFTTTSEPFGLAVGDANGDHHADVFALTTIPDGPHIELLYGNGQLSLTPGPSVALPGEAIGMIAATDFNADGMTDVVVTDPNAGTVTTFLGGPGGLTARDLRQGLTQPLGLAIADLNGDGIADVIAGSESPEIFLLLGNGDGTLRDAQRYEASPAGNLFVATADFTAEGRDGVVSSALFVDTISVLTPAPPLVVEGHGDGTYAVDATGTATIAVTAEVRSRHGGVSFEWREGTSVLGSGASATIRLVPGDHTVTLVGTTGDGLFATDALAIVVATPSAAQFSLDQLHHKVDLLGASIATQGSIVALSAKVDALDGKLATLASEALLTSLTALVQLNLDTTVGSRASSAQVAQLATSVNEIKTKLPSVDMIAGIATAVASLNASLAAADRQAIELALARGDRVASLYLPAGGRLDQVKAIVVGLVNQVAAGKDVTRARRLIAEGDEQRARAQYRRAYDKYVDAYQALADSDKW